MMLIERNPDVSFSLVAPRAMTKRRVGRSSLSALMSDNSWKQVANASTEGWNRQLLAFPQLQARDFQNPKDKQATSQLSSPIFLPIEFGLRNVVLPAAEDAGFLENIGTGVLVSNDQYPTIYRLAVEAAAQMNLPVPDVFVKQNPVPNAYTLAIQGKKPSIVLHTSLIDLMTLEEVKAVIGHEMGHLKCEHSLWITVLNILSLGVDIVELVVPLGLRQIVSRQLVQWRRSAELTCDRASMLVVQDEDVVISVMMKLAGGAQSLAGEMSPKAFARQANEYDDATRSSPLGRLIRRQDEDQLYPLPIQRAREIQKYAASDEYAQLKTRLGKKLQVSGRLAQAS